MTDHTKTTLEVRKKIAKSAPKSAPFGFGIISIFVSYERAQWERLDSDSAKVEIKLQMTALARIMDLIILF